MTMEISKKKALVEGHAAKIRDLARVARNHIEAIIANDVSEDDRCNSLKEASKEFLNIISSAKSIEKLVGG